MDGNKKEISDFDIITTSYDHEKGIYFPDNSPQYRGKKVQYFLESQQICLKKFPDMMEITVVGPYEEIEKQECLKRNWKHTVYMCIKQTYKQRMDEYLKNN